jgi:protein-S-isoprenylcysteine O-methyltransferase Ste14
MIAPWLERWAGHPEHAFRDVVVFLCALAVLFSVTWSFLSYHGRRAVVRGQRSVVDTFTMLLFFGVVSGLVARRVGVIAGLPAGVERVAIVCGIAALLLGGVVNVLGRHQLGPTWSNQIAIYERHQLITGGWFRLVRHPLYASTIWMFLGAGVAFVNYAVLLATLLVFVPAMTYRARQEERWLQAAFPGYEDYRRTTGAFFPRLSVLKRKSP